MAQNNAIDKVKVCFVLVRHVVSEFLIVLKLERFLRFKTTMSTSMWEVRRVRGENARLLAEC